MKPCVPFFICFRVSLEVVCRLRRNCDVWLLPVQQKIGGKGRKRIYPLIFQMFCNAVLKGYEKNLEKISMRYFFTSGRCLFLCRWEGEKNLQIVIFRVSSYAAQ